MRRSVPSWAQGGTPGLRWERRLRLCLLFPRWLHLLLWAPKGWESRDGGQIPVRTLPSVAITGLHPHVDDEMVFRAWFAALVKGLAEDKADDCDLRRHGAHSHLAQCGRPQGTAK